MSSRGSLALGSKLLAESKQLIPISWLAFLAPDHVEPLLEIGSVVIERKTAIKNFDNNAQFLTDITSGSLDFGLSEPLITRVRSSRSRTLGIGIGELISRDVGDAGIPGIKLIIDAIARKDAGLSYSRPSCELINPATGDLVMVQPVSLTSTAEIMYSVCWITKRMLQIAKRNELETMVTGYIWS